MSSANRQGRSKLRQGLRYAAQKPLICIGYAADVAVAKHLRTTVLFLVSARPLSFQWRRRDLVSSMRGFLQPAGDLVVDVLRAVVGVALIVTGKPSSMALTPAPDRPRRAARKWPGVTQSTALR